MAIVTVEIGAPCTGGNHVLVETLVDGVVVHSEGMEVAELIAGPSLVSALAARDEILRDTGAQPNINAFRGVAESKNVTIPDGAPVESEAGISLNSSPEERNGPR